MVTDGRFILPSFLIEPGRLAALFAMELRISWKLFEASLIPELKV